MPAALSLLRWERPSLLPGGGRRTLTVNYDPNPRQVTVVDQVELNAYGSGKVTWTGDLDDFLAACEQAQPFRSTDNQGFLASLLECTIKISSVADGDQPEHTDNRTVLFPAKEFLALRERVTELA